MKRLITFLLFPALLLLVSGCQVEGGDPANADDRVALPELAPVGATLLDGLGDHSMPISTDHPEVQQWFDQGLMLTYGFNHDAAERSFLKAASLEPECAMCWWGAALVMGPNINAPMPPEANPAAYERLQAAVALAPNASEREQAYIEALSARYTAEAPDDRSSLDEDYASAMAALVERYPDDLDAATLYAESLMNLQPWDFWADDATTPRGNTMEIVRVLESVMDRSPEHPGALHLYIHAVEASDGDTLKRGEWAADQLRALIPGSGHLVHMPSHIYARVGRWRDAAAVNRDAIKADDAYLAICRPQPGVYPLGYVPHNHHFLWFASSMIGDRDTALAAARSTSERTSDPELMRAPGLEAMQNFAFTPVFAKVRFGMWDEIAELPAPDDDLPYMTALWHYAQAVATVRQGHMEQAAEHHAALSELAGHPAFDEMLWFGRYPLTHGVRVAERIAAAEIALAGGDTEAAIDSLREAIGIEDAIPYDEPPGWHHPVRQILGAVLLEAGKPEEAESVYRAELRRNPDNGWSLFGLQQALLAQGRDEDAESVGGRFDEAWADAGVELTASRF
jgi:tetratricopeptide (TPR) repeat protein